MFKKIFRGSVTAGSGVVLFVSGSSVVSAEGEDYSFLLNKEYNKEIDPLLEETGEDTFKIKNRPTCLKDNIRKTLTIYGDKKITDYLNLDKEKCELTCKLQDLRLKYLNNGQFLDDKGKISSSTDYNEEKCVKEMIDCYKQLAACRGSLKGFLENNKDFLKNILSPLVKFGVPGFETDEAEAFEAVDNFDLLLCELSKGNDYPFLFSKDRMDLDAEILEVGNGIYKIKGRPSDVDRFLIVYKNLTGKQLDSELVELLRERCGLTCEFQDLRQKFINGGWYVDGDGRKVETVNYEENACARDLLVCYKKLLKLREDISQFFDKEFSKDDKLQKDKPEDKPEDKPKGKHFQSNKEKWSIRFDILSNSLKKELKKEIDYNNLAEWFFGLVRYVAGEKFAEGYSFLFDEQYNNDLDTELKGKNHLPIWKALGTTRLQSVNTDDLREFYDLVDKDAKFSSNIQYFRKKLRNRPKGKTVSNSVKEEVLRCYLERETVREKIKTTPNPFASDQIKEFFYPVMNWLYYNNVESDEDYFSSFESAVSYMRDLPRATAKAVAEKRAVLNREYDKDLDANIEIVDGIPKANRDELEANQPFLVKDLYEAVGINDDLSSQLFELVDDECKLTLDLQSLRLLYKTGRFGINLYNGVRYSTCLYTCGGDSTEKDSYVLPLIKCYLDRELAREKIRKFLIANKFDLKKRFGEIRLFDLIENVVSGNEKDGSMQAFLSYVRSIPKKDYSFLFGKGHKPPILDEDLPPEEKVIQWLFKGDCIYKLVQELYENRKKFNEERENQSVDNLKAREKVAVELDEASRIIKEEKGKEIEKELKSDCFELSEKEKIRKEWKNVGLDDMEAKKNIEKELEEGCYSTKARKTIYDELKCFSEEARRKIKKEFAIAVLKKEGFSSEARLRIKKEVMKGCSNIEVRQKVEEELKKVHDSIEARRKIRKIVEDTSFITKTREEIRLKLLKDFFDVRTKEEIRKNLNGRCFSVDERKMLEGVLGKGSFSIDEYIGSCDENGKSKIGVVECYKSLWESYIKIGKHFYKRFVESKYSDAGPFSIGCHYERWLCPPVECPDSEKEELEKNLLDSINSFLRSLLPVTSEIKYSELESSDLNKGFILSSKSLDDV